MASKRVRIISVEIEIEEYADEQPALRVPHVRAGVQVKRAVFLLAMVLAACGGIAIVDVDGGAADVDPCSIGPGCIAAPDGGR